MSMELKCSGEIPEGHAMVIVCLGCGHEIIIGQDKHILALDGTSVIKCECGKEFVLTIVQQAGRPSQ